MRGKIVVICCCAALACVIAAERFSVAQVDSDVRDRNTGRREAYRSDRSKWRERGRNELRSERASRDELLQNRLRPPQRITRPLDTERRKETRPIESNEMRKTDRDDQSQYRHVRARRADRSEIREQSDQPRQRRPERRERWSVVRRVSHEQDVSQPVEKSAPTLTLEELVTLAERHNPTLTQATAWIRRAEGLWDQAGLAANPTLSYIGDDIGEDASGGKHGGEITQKLITGNKRQLDRDIASYGVEQARRRFEVQRQRVVNDVREAYYSALIARRRLKVARELSDVADKSLKAIIKLRDQGGIGTTLDVKQASVEANFARVKQLDSEYRVNQAWREIVALIGQPEMPQAELEDDLKNGDVDISWRDALQRTIVESPEIAVARAGIDRARLAVERARAQAVPDVTVGGGVQVSDVGETISLAFLEIPIPIYNKNRGGIAAAEADLMAAESEIRRIELSLQHRLASAYADYEAAKAKVDLYANKITVDAKAALDLVEKAYTAGEVDYLRKLSAQRTYADTYFQYIQAISDLRMASAQIEGYMLSGGLDRPKK